MEDFAQVMRRLWHGELVFNHDGPIGKYQLLFLDPDFDEDIRLAIVAFGPQTLALGGREFDEYTYAFSGPAASPAKGADASTTSWAPSSMRSG